MNTTNSILRWALLALVVLFTAWVTGCEKVGPLSPALVINNQPQMISLPGPRGLKKMIPVSQLITPAAGGVVKLTYDNGQVLNRFTIDVSLTFEPSAVSKDVMVSMSLDDSLLILDFGPSMTFNIAANLQVKATGLDLSRFGSSNGCKLYVYDTAIGAWVEMPADITVTPVVSGTLECWRGEVPHFSRYGFGR